VIKIFPDDTQQQYNTWDQSSHYKLPIKNNLENNLSSSCSCCSSDSESDCCSKEENINETNISGDGYQINLGTNGDNDNYYQKTIKTNQYLSGYGNYPININYDNNNWNISVPNSDHFVPNSRNMHDDSDNDNVDEYSVNMHLSESDSEEVIDRY